jgi:hypothetical protein
MSEVEDIFENDEEFDREAAEELERARLRRRSTTGVRNLIFAVDFFYNFV